MRKILAIFVMILMLVSTISVAGNNIINKYNDNCKECKKTNQKYLGMTDIPPRSEKILKMIDNDPNPTGSYDNIPSQFNWANYGGNWVTPVKDQAYPVYCGSCYIFAAWGAFEAAIDIASGDPGTDIDLSEQYGLSCINSGCNGCGGGWGTVMLQNIVSDAPGQSGNGINGVPIESCMPYQADDDIPCSSKCSDWDTHTEPLLQPDDKLWQIKNWGSFSISEDSQSDWNYLKSQLIEKGPIAVTIAWTNGLQDFVETHHDPDDVYENDDPGSTNHLILLVGWKDDPDIMNGGYWILKNSHGTSQGYGGYCNIAYGCNLLGCSECDWVIAEDWPEDQSGPGPVDVDMAVFSDFNYESDCPHPNERIEFSDISEGDIALREWDFDNDGVIDSNKKRPTWTYDQVGEYEVTLTVYSEWGLSNTRTKTIKVKENWPPEICELPSEFVGSDLTYHFDARYCYDPDGTIDSYYWDFADGTTSNLEYLNHEFPEPDMIYDVKLTITDNQDESTTDYCKIKIDQTIPPETEIHHGYGNDETDYYSETQRISFSATDWTGVIDTFYRINDGNWVRYVESDNKYIPISSEGEHTIEAYSVDYYGNKETPVTDNFIIDKTPPTLDINIDGNQDDEWFINNVDVALIGEDGSSGIDRIYYKYKTTNWVEYYEPFVIDDINGHFNLYSIAVDKAGNQYSTEKEILIKTINSPSVPSITGPRKINPGEEITYEIVSNDPGNEISYYINWGDGDTDGWMGTYESGEKIKVTHTYEEKEIFTIKVKAKNQYDVESEWGTHDISTTKSKSTLYKNLLYDFLIDHFLRFISYIFSLN